MERHRPTTCDAAIHPRKDLNLYSEATRIRWMGKNSLVLLIKGIDL